MVRICHKAVMVKQNCDHEIFFKKGMVLLDLVLVNSKNVSDLSPLEIVFEIVDDPATFDDVFDEDSGDVVSSAGITGIALPQLVQKSAVIFRSLPQN